MEWCKHYFYALKRYESKRKWLYNLDICSFGAYGPPTVKLPKKLKYKTETSTQTDTTFTHRVEFRMCGTYARSG